MRIPNTDYFGHIHIRLRISQTCFDSFSQTHFFLELGTDFLECRIGSEHRLSK